MLWTGSLKTTIYCGCQGQIQDFRKENWWTGERTLYEREVIFDVVNSFWSMVTGEQLDAG